MHYHLGETLGGCPDSKSSGLPFPGLVPAPLWSHFWFFDCSRDSWRLGGSLRSHLQSLCCRHRSKWDRPQSGWNLSLPPSVALDSEKCNTTNKKNNVKLHLWWGERGLEPMLILPKFTCSVKWRLGNYPPYAFQENRLDIIFCIQGKAFSPDLRWQIVDLIFCCYC